MGSTAVSISGSQSEVQWTGFWPVFKILKLDSENHWAEKPGCVRLTCLDIVKSIRFAWLRVLLSRVRSLWLRQVKKMSFKSSYRSFLLWLSMGLIQPVSNPDSGSFRQAWTYFWVWQTGFLCLRSEISNMSSLGLKIEADGHWIKPILFYTYIYYMP